MFIVIILFQCVGSIYNAYTYRNDLTEYEYYALFEEFTDECMETWCEEEFFKEEGSIEPVIDHMKREHRLGRNYLGGIRGDKINPILSASVFNMQKLLRSFAVSFLFLFP